MQDDNEMTFGQIIKSVTDGDFLLLTDIRREMQAVIGPMLHMDMIGSVLINSAVRRVLRSFYDEGRLVNYVFEDSMDLVTGDLSVNLTIVSSFNSEPMPTTIIEIRRPV